MRIVKRIKAAKRQPANTTRRHVALSWAIESLEPRRLLHHQIDATFIPDNPSDPGTGQWVVAANAQADESNEPEDPAPAGFVPGTVIASAALPGLPTLNSDLNAHAAIYLDFNGDAGGQTAYDEDGDPTTFNATEVAHITAAWQAISTYFAPFDVNVTTVKPATAIPTAWGMIGNSISGGYSYVGVFPDVQRFGGPGSFDQSSDARTRTSGMTHEYGHNFGLQHQSDYNSLGVKTNEYSSGFNSTHGPIMGVDFAQTVHKWFIGHPSNSNSTLQDDLAVISGSIKSGVGSGDGYRADDYGGTIATATPLTVNGDIQSASGIIERMSDADTFSFTSAGAQTMIDVNPTGPSGLAPKVEIYDSAGNLLGSRDDTNQRNGTNNDERFPIDLPAGTYYVTIKSHGDYGDIGQYSVTAQALPAGWVSQDIGNPTTFGNSQYNSATGTFTVAGSGTDIWGTTDQFQYAWQTLSGDGSLTARVVSQQNTGSFNKAGVMIRESTAANSKQAMCILSPGNGVRLQYRAATGGTSTDVAGTTTLAAPYWVRITRAGNTFTAASSPNGVTWTTVSSTTIAMNAGVTIGLAVDSTNNSVLNTTKFDNVTLTGNVGLGLVYNALPAPTSLTVVPGTGTGLTLNWTDVTGETGYTIERSIDGTTWTQAGTTAAGITTYNDNSLYGSMRYFYRVSSNDASGKSVPSDPVSAINRPNAPFGLNTFSISATQIVLNWRDVSGETGYRIERSTDGGVTFTTLATVGVNIPSYTDSGMTANTVREYRVTALSAEGDSPVSTVTTASTRLATATGQSFTTIATNQLAIQWTAVAGATGYRIERSTDGTTFTSLATIGNVLTYSDSTVTPLNAYYYRVIGTDSLTEGIAPAAIFAATPAAAALPAPWLNQDIGAVSASGAAGFSGGTYTLLASGADIFGTADAMQYAYEPLTGDGTIIARVATQLNTSTSAKSGVMFRESTAAGSRQVMVQVTPSGIFLQYRAATGGTTTSVTGTASVVAPYWVKLTRAGNVFTAFSSADGITWTTVGSATVAMSAGALVGLADTSHSTTAINKSTFDNVTVTNAAPTVATAAAASPAIVTGTTTILSVLGADDHGEAGLTYTWAATGPALVTFTGGTNGTNAAKNLTANFLNSGTYGFTCTISDGVSSVTSSTTVSVRRATIANRAIFYNDSFFDNNDLTANAADDAAIAPDKAALLPGQTTTFTNYTSYDKGINGVIVDVANLPSGPLGAPDFDFSVTTDGATFTPAPAPDSITVRPGAGLNGSDRVEIIFPDVSIRNQWLRVTLNAGANSGLANPDVFYFGNLVGCSGAHNGNAIVNATDAANAKIQNGAVVGVSSLVDYNRSGKVTVSDVATVRLNNLHTIPLFTAPAAAPAPAVAAAAPAAQRSRTPVTAAATRAGAVVPPFSVVPILPSWITTADAKKKDVLQS